MFTCMKKCTYTRCNVALQVARLYSDECRHFMNFLFCIDFKYLSDNKFHFTQHFQLLIIQEQTLNLRRREASCLIFGSICICTTYKHIIQCYLILLLVCMSYIAMKPAKQSALIKQAHGRLHEMHQKKKL